MNTLVLLPAMPYVRFTIWKTLLLFCCTLSHSVAFTQTEFSQENAEALLRTLVLEIGPRPMGSPAEQKALAFAVRKFDEYGCDTSYVLPMTVAEGVNTKSGVAIGVRKGKTGHIIIIAGHIDTSGPDIPGANDDGSGTACVLELARVLCSRDNESTVLFCCWGGEEQGLRGSNHFVNTFTDLDSVVLMLQLDMADGSSYLIADPDGKKRSAPAWLLEAAFEAARELNRDDLVYHTGMATWNLAVGGAFSSDHSRFIDKGIPAICFTSDVTLPIHTPQDSWENFTPSGLKRSGDLVLKLFERFDRGVPSRDTERYQVLQIGGRILVVPYSLLWTLAVLSLGTGVVLFFVLFKRRPPQDPAIRIKWSGFKLLLATLFIHMCMWSSETVLGAVKGYRYPWVNNTAGFWVLGFLAGGIAFWFVLQATRRYRLSIDAFIFARIAIILFSVLIVAAAFLTPELALYPSAALLCLAGAMFFRPAVAKLVLVLLAGIIMYKMLFFDGILLFQRSLAMSTRHLFLQHALAEAVAVLFYGILSLPMVYGSVAVYRSSSVDLFGLKKFRKRGGLIVTGVAAFAVAAYLYVRPVYDRLWQSVIRVEQNYVMNEDATLVSNTLEVRGSEYLHDVRTTLSGRDSMIFNSSNYQEMTLSEDDVDWAKVSSTTGSPVSLSDTAVSLQRTVEIHTAFRPLRIEATFGSTDLFEVSSPWGRSTGRPDPSQRETDRRKRFVWYAFPETPLSIPVTITMRPAQKIAQTVRVIFDSLAYPLRVHRSFTNVSYRTIVTGRDTISLATPTTSDAR